MAGLADLSPGGWLACGLLIWIVAFPLYLAKRSEIKALAAAGSGGQSVSSPGVQYQQPQPLLATDSQKKKPSLIVVFGGGFILLILVLVFIAALTNPEEAARSISNASSGPTPIVTKVEYEALYIGMTYEAAKNTIGAHGEEMSRNEIGGITTVMYMWQNRDGSNMNAMFQNGAMIQKAQFGLK